MTKKSDKTHDTITVTNNDIAIARGGVTVQAERFGVDLSVPENKAFFEHVVSSIATHNAWHVFNQKIIHDYTFTEKRGNDA